MSAKVLLSLLLAALMLCPPRAATASPRVSLQSPTACPPLPPPGGVTVVVADESGLRARAYDAPPNVTILVAAGTYSEIVTMRAGISLKGGYSTDFLTRDWDTFQSKISMTSIASGPSALVATDGTITSETVIEGMYVDVQLTGTADDGLVLRLGSLGLERVRVRHGLERLVVPAQPGERGRGWGQGAAGAEAQA